MNKLLLVIMLLISVELSAQSIQFEFADTTNGKVVQRKVSYQYPLPVRWYYNADTTKVVNWNGSVLTTPFPVKLYNTVLKFISLNFG